MKYVANFSISVLVVALPPNALYLYSAALSYANALATRCARLWSFVIYLGLTWTSWSCVIECDCDRSLVFMLYLVITV
jgi:hypothetical protein